MVVMGILCWTVTGWASIPEPDVIYYGEATHKGKLEPATEEISLVLDVSSQTLASYLPGSIEAYGYSYVLRVPMDALASIEGQAATFYIGGRLAGTTHIPSKGSVVLMDLDTLSSNDSDGDGMDDTWEMQYFGNLARGGDGDINGNGFTDREEYENGTDPTAPVWVDIDDTHRKTCIFHPLVLLIVNVVFFTQVIGFRMQVFASFVLRLVNLNLYPVCLGEFVMANTGNLPGNLHTRLPTGNGELVISNLCGNIKIWSWGTNGCKLIPKIPVQGFKVIWKLDCRLPAGIKCYHTVVDIHHIRGFHKGVEEVFVFRVKGVVDLKGAAALGQSAGNLSIAIKVSCPAIGFSRGSSINAIIIVSALGYSINAIVFVRAEAGPSEEGDIRP